MKNGFERSEQKAKGYISYLTTREDTSTNPPKARATKEPQNKKRKEVEPDDKADALVSNETAPDEEDDQTAALLAGFESSSESERAGDHEENALITGDLPIPPPPPSATAKTRDANEKQKTSEEDEPGTLYIGRIPHGFYEPQMKSYFSQFGDITRLRMARNRRTGASKHFAFVEFASAEVARIVADTMDNYLMFGHILRVKFIPKEQVHAELWKGATGRRFKKMPWNGIERGRLKSADREQWAKRVEKEEQRRKEKADKLKKLGYEFDMPSIQSVDSVPRKGSPLNSEEKKNGSPKQIAPAPASELDINTLLENQNVSHPNKIEVLQSVD